MADWTEFYVTCNPRLLPRGVGHIIETVTRALKTPETTEILYEPEIPWFKCIAAPEDKTALETALQDALTALLEAETAPIDLDLVHENTTGQDGLSQADIVIMADNPHCAPWFAQEDLASLDLAVYDEHRFPAALQAFKFRATWRAMEDSPADNPMTLPTFLDKLPLHGLGAPTNLEELEALLMCGVSHNLAGNLLYIGTDISATVLDKALRNLNTLLQLCLNPAEKPKSSLPPLRSLLEDNLIDLDTDSEEDIADHDSSHISASNDSELVPIMEGDDLIWFGEGVPPLKMEATRRAEDSNAHLLDVKPEDLEQAILHTGEDNRGTPQNETRKTSTQRDRNKTRKNKSQQTPTGTKSEKEKKIRPYEFW